MNEQHLQHYENFPVASWLCPARLRPPIAAIYRFARMADDVADEGQFAADDRLARLAEMRALLERAGAGPESVPSGDPVFGPLAVAIRDFNLPLQPLRDLLDAFSQDVAYTRDGRRYAALEDLLGYCARSANPVGRLLLHLYGITDPHSLKRSDQICTALQLINFWQDFSVDLPRERHYLPDSILHQFDLKRTALRAGYDTPQTRAAIEFCARHARQMMQEGAPLAKTIPGRAGWELRLVVQGGLRILDKIEALGFQTLSTRPVLAKTDLLVLLWRSAWM